MEAWQPGSRFGDLEIERELGRGTFGSVLLARDTLVGRHVALKILRLPGGGSREEERAALLREAQLVGRLRSAHVATLYRVHQIADGWAFELEYVEGGSLEDLLARGPRIPIDEAGRIAQGILKGLGDAHEHGVVHGDIKPGNVLLTADGSVKLVDFGLAHLMGEFSLRAPRDEVVGTPAYMAPEVIMGEHPTRASDLWSFGVVLYRMLSGRHPFPGRSLPALFQAIQNAAPPPLDAQLPPHLADLALHCLAKAPGGRPASSADALQELLPAAVAEPRHVAHRPERPRPQLFGRSAERGRLHAAAERAAAGLGTTVLLTGSFGAGKSALAADLAAHADALGFRWAETRVTAIEGLLRPVVTALRDLVTQPGPGGLAEIESRLFGTATGLLRTLFEGTGPVPLESRQQVAWGLEELLLGLSAERPLGLLVDDAHLANAEDWKLVSDLARRIRQIPVLFCVCAATDGTAAPALPDAGPVEDVRLGPLDPEAVTRLLHARADGARVAPEVLRRVFDVSEGNPLFAIELFRHLRDSGAISRHGDVLAPGAGWGRVALPRRLRDLALARLSGLPEEQRALLDAAAVDGVAFEGESIAAVTGRPLLDVLRMLQEIYRRTGLILPRASGYRFAHAVLQEGIYEEIAPVLRRALHVGLAEHLEGRASPVLPERLGIHWERAGDPARARPHLVHAARDALRRQDHLRATDLLARGGLDPRGLTAADVSAHAALLLDATDTYAALGRHEDMEAVFKALLDAAERDHDEALRLEANVRRAQRLYLRQGLVGVDEAMLRAAAERLAPSEHRGRANYLLGMIAKYRGDLDEAERRLGEADRDFVECHMGLHSSALDQLGSVCLRRGRWREAEALYADAARISAIVGRRPNAAVSEINGILAAYMRGALDGLVPKVDAAIQKLAIEGSAGQVAGALALLSKIQYAAGDTAGAWHSVEEALRAAKRAGSLTAQLTALPSRAQLLYAEGKLDAARADLHAARSLAATREDFTVRLEISVSECRLASVLGDNGRACAAAAAALRALGAVPPPEAHQPSVAALAEAVLYGLPADALAPLDDLLARSGAASARAAHAGACAFADAHAPADALLGAAELLRGPGVGPLRATLRVVASLLAAEGQRRLRQIAAARREAEAGIRDAAALRHVWLEALLARLLARIGGEGAAKQVERRLQAVAAGLVDEAERTRVIDRWLRA